MGKRCLEECPYLAEDGTCLLPVEELREKCPKRETTKHEEKDEWMLERKRQTSKKTIHGKVGTVSLEDV